VLDTLSQRRLMPPTRHKVLEYATAYTKALQTKGGEFPRIQGFSEVRARNAAASRSDRARPLRRGDDHIAGYYAEDRPARAAVGLGSWTGAKRRPRREDGKARPVVRRAEREPIWGESAPTSGATIYCVQGPCICHMISLRPARWPFLGQSEGRAGWESSAASRVVHGPVVPAPTLRRRSAVGEIPPRLPPQRLLSCGPSLTSSPDGFPAGHSNGKAGARRTGAKRRPFPNWGLALRRLFNFS
jgi:hypothetical protein